MPSVSFLGTTEQYYADGFHACFSEAPIQKVYDYQIPEGGCFFP